MIAPCNYDLVLIICFIISAHKKVNQLREFAAQTRVLESDHEELLQQRKVRIFVQARSFALALGSDNGYVLPTVGPSRAAATANAQPRLHAALRRELRVAPAGCSDATRLQWFEKANQRRQGRRRRTRLSCYV